MPRLAAGRRDELTRTRRDQIVDAAIRCWLEHGFDTTTVDAIAREAGVGKGTLYLYFPTKQDILDAAIARHSLLPDIDRVVSAFAGRPLADLVPVLVRAIWIGGRAQVGVVKLLVRELPVRPDHARTFIERVVLPANDALASRFAAAPDARAGVDHFVAARGLVGILMLFLFTQEVCGGKDIRPIADDRLIAGISEVFLHGVARSS